MLNPRRLLAALLGVLGLTLLAVPAHAQTAPGPPPPGGRSAIGGEQLSGTGVIVSPGAPPIPGITASGWVVADLDTGKILAARDPHGAYGPASTLKTLTALTLLPQIPATQLLTPTFDDVAIDGSKVGLVQNLAYPAKEVFEAMLMVSGNDAASTLATAFGGQAATVAAMNAEAKHLQALDTTVANVSGLDAAGQVSSAYDLALINRAAMQLPDFRTYIATKSSSISAPGGARFQIYNHNKLLGKYPGALGIKNGYTVAQRASFVGAATQNGHTILVSLMRANPAVQDEAVALLNWGFAATAAGVQPVGTLVDPVPPPTQAPAVAAPAKSPAALATTAKKGGGLPWLPLAAGVTMVAVSGVVVRRRFAGAGAGPKPAAAALPLITPPPAPPGGTTTGGHVRRISSSGSDL